MQFSDRTFIAKFAGVIVLLHLVVASFAVIAYALGEKERDMDKERAGIERRIAPVAKVATSQEELVAMAPASAPTAGVSAASGDQVVQQVCSACHGAGLLGAPKMHDHQAWQARLSAAGGVDGLVASATRGKNQMPPRGGQPGLTDQQLRQAIDVMRN
jgi:cytochrome c5